MISADEGMGLAKFLRPGCVVIVGPEFAVCAAEPAADEQPIWRKNRLDIKGSHQFPAWHGDYDFYKEHGWHRNAWVRFQGLLMMLAAGRQLTFEEWEWLNLDQTGLAEIGRWILENKRIEA